MSFNFQLFSVVTFKKPKQQDILCDNANNEFSLKFLPFSANRHANFKHWVLKMDSPLYLLQYLSRKFKIKSRWEIYTKVKDMTAGAGNVNKLYFHVQAANCFFFFFVKVMWNRREIFYMCFATCPRFTLVSLNWNISPYFHTLKYLLQL